MLLESRGITSYEQHSGCCFSRDEVFEFTVRRVLDEDHAVTGSTGQFQTFLRGKSYRDYVCGGVLQRVLEG